MASVSIIDPHDYKEVDIREYFNNQCESVLKALKEGNAIVFKQESDIDHVVDPTSQFGMMPLDFRWMGGTYSILVGRPAEKELRKIKYGS